jgi:hypothetical protein
MKIIIVSYHFTPGTMVAALRARGLAKYLGRAGHSVIVVTAEQSPETSSDWDVVTIPGRMPSSRVRSALGVSEHHAVADVLAGGGRTGARAQALRAARWLARELLFWPDEAAGWSGRVGKWLQEAIDSGEVDAIVTTSPPPSTHMPAMSARRGDAVWVADFRDLWTLAHHYPLSPIRRWLDRRWDARIFREADAVTVATDGFAEIARAAFPDANVRSVYNGFDPESLVSAPGAATVPTRHKRFTLVHAGTLYGGRVDPAVLLDALASLVDSGRVPRDRIRVEFFSAREGWLSRAITERGLEDVVVVHGIRPREVVTAAYGSADALVLLQWNDPGEAAVMPAKTFEYLGSRRPVIAIGSPPGGEVDRILERTGAGHVTRSVAETAGAIAELFDEFVQTGRVVSRADESEVARHCQEEMARAMLAAIESAIGRRGGNTCR